jgi:fluoroacetyl-CoA thioesterase
MNDDPLANIHPGMAGERQVVVTRELTVGGHVEGMPFVYGTPMMILLMELASGEAIASHLPTGWVSVGSEVNIRHLAPTAMGRLVTARGRVLETSRRSILFEVEAFDGDRKIGEGTHRRGVVNLEEFAKRYPGGA